jgi:Cu/Ag efflux protein CusF
VLGGLGAGVLIAWAVGANATTTSGSAAGTAQPAAYGSGAPGPRHPDGRHLPGTFGTVTAVGAHSLTIKTASGTKTYAVTSSSELDKDGPAKLSDLKVGDEVVFDTTTANGRTVIAHLHDGIRHGGPHPLGDSGTVTAVGAHSVTIKTSTGTKTYAVTSSSDIDKNGEAELSDLKVGDRVRFDTEVVGGRTVIDHLHAGDEALDRPGGRPHD